MAYNKKSAKAVAVSSGDTEEDDSDSESLKILQKQGFKSVFPPTKGHCPFNAPYEPWKYFGKKEPPDAFIEVYNFRDDKEQPKPTKLLGIYPLHKRILGPQSPAFAAHFEKTPNSTARIKLYYPLFHILSPIFAYMYLHDFDRLSSTYSTVNEIRNAEHLMKARPAGEYHDNKFRARNLYHVNLYIMAARFKMKDLCDLIVERYITVYDVPPPGVQEHNSQHKDYKYSPFVLWNMRDRCKREYIDLVYHDEHVEPMVIGKSGNLRWAVMLGMLGRRDILETFDFHFEDFPRFHADILKTMEWFTKNFSNPKERERSRVYKQYKELLRWSEGIAERRKENAKRFNAYLETTENLSFYDIDKENVVMSGVEETDGEETSSEEEL